MDPLSLSLFLEFPAAFFSSTEGDASFILRCGRKRRKERWMESVINIVEEEEVIEWKRRGRSLGRSYDRVGKVS